MSLRLYGAASSAVVVITLSAGFVSAHVGFTGVGHANQTQVLPFVVGHGCEGAETSKIEIPETVTSVRAVPSVFGPIEVKKNDSGVVTSVVWTNPQPKASDDYLYELAIRAKLPDAPFTTVLFPTKQTCKDKDGNEVVVDWKATPRPLKKLPPPRKAKNRIQHPR